MAASPARAVRNKTETTGMVPIGKRGNYTCRAVNVAGEDVITVNVGADEEASSSGLKTIAGHSTPPAIEILTTPFGFILTAVLLVTLGFIFKHQ